MLAGFYNLVPSFASTRAFEGTVIRTSIEFAWKNGTEIGKFALGVVTEEPITQALKNSFNMCYNSAEAANAIWQKLPGVCASISELQYVEMSFRGVVGTATGEYLSSVSPWAAPILGGLAVGGSAALLFMGCRGKKAPSTHHSTNEDEKDKQKKMTLK